MPMNAIAFIDGSVDATWTKCAGSALWRGHLQMTEEALPGLFFRQLPVELPVDVHVARQLLARHRAAGCSAIGMLPCRMISSWNCLFVMILRVDELACAGRAAAGRRAGTPPDRAAGSDTARTRTSGALRRWRCRARGRPCRRGSPRSPAATSRPMWKFSEKMMRAQRCMRQNSAPIFCSGVLLKPSSYSVSSQ